jgi:hypothetical protein
VKPAVENIRNKAATDVVESEPRDGTRTGEACSPARYVRQRPGPDKFARSGVVQAKRALNERDEIRA